MQQEGAAHCPRQQEARACKPQRVAHAVGEADPLDLTATNVTTEQALQSFQSFIAGTQTKNNSRLQVRRRNLYTCTHARTCLPTCRRTRSHRPRD